MGWAWSWGLVCVCFGLVLGLGLGFGWVGLGFCKHMLCSCQRQTLYQTATIRSQAEAKPIQHYLV
ncbi:hypothetical protein AAHH84_00280 [Candidatus Hodgkinia cicadicola]